jgi:hypothetical protein
MLRECFRVEPGEFSRCLPLVEQAWSTLRDERLKRVFAIDIETCPKCGKTPLHTPDSGLFASHDRHTISHPSVSSTEITGPYFHIARFRAVILPVT